MRKKQCIDRKFTNNVKLDLVYWILSINPDLIENYSIYRQASRLI